MAIVYGVKKIHQYLYGQRFEINTTINLSLDCSKRISKCQQWLQLEYKGGHRPWLRMSTLTKFKEGKKHCNSDGLSRLPQEVSVDEQPEPGKTVLLMEQVETMPVTAKQIW